MIAATATPLGRYFDERGIVRAGIAHGLTTPARFTDPVAEHLATRRAAGLFDFSFMACAEISGPDSLAFLQRIQTRDLSRLLPGRIAYALMLRPDGTMLNDITVWCLGEQHYDLFSGRYTDVDHLRALARGHAISITDRSLEQTVLAVQGTRSWRVVSRCLSGLPAALPYYAFCDAQFQGVGCRVACIGYSGETGYELIVNAECGLDLWRALFAAGADCGLAECGFGAADSLRIEAGHILFTRELALPVRPFELGLTRLLDFYREPAIGMAALRPQRWREPSQRLVGLVPECADMSKIEPLMAMDSNAQRSSVSGGAVLTSVCMSPVFGYPIGLGFVDPENRHPGMRVKLANGISARVARLPFYDPAKLLTRRTA